VKELRQSIPVAHEVSSEIKQRERAAELRRGREREEREKMICGLQQRINLSLYMFF